MTKNRKTGNSRSRAEYIRAFLSLLEEKEFEAISVQEIIQKSTYSRAGFYRHFSDKYELAETIVREEAVAYASLLAEGMFKLEGKPPARYLYNLSLEVLLHVEAHKSLYRAVLTSRLPGLGLEAFCGYAVEAFRGESILPLRESMEELDMEFYYYCTTHQFIRYICYWERTGFTKEPEEMAKQIAALYEWLEPGKLVSL